MSSASTSEQETFKFQAEVSQVLGLVINSLYSKKEIFLRELISNAADALERLEFRALTEHGLLAGDHAKEIRVSADDIAGTLTIEDTGVGMTRDELIRNLGTVAHSGSRAFLEQLRRSREQGDAGAASGSPGLIGQFGVGFYSSFLVADRVVVESRPAAGGEAHRWVSDAKGEFTIEPGTRQARGTAVVLHIQDEHREYLKPWRLRELITRYSDFVSFPVKLLVEKDTDLKDLDGNPLRDKVFETANRASAVWRRPKSEVTAEEYDELYRHLSHDYEGALAHTHFRVEGAQSFIGLLYIPKRPPYDMFDPQEQRGVRLYVKRVFIMDECKELVPQWLRFLRGLIDSDDLELNVSREILQRSQTARAISKQIVKRTLDLLDEIAAERREDFEKLWVSFGAILKEGLFFDSEQRERIAHLVRYRSTAGDGWTSLADYVARMPEGQAAIYYAMGASLVAITGSPYLEGLRRRGFEVLLMTDTVDEWAVSSLHEFDGKPLVSAMKADLDLGTPAADAGASAGKSAVDVEPLLRHVALVLGDRVQEVRKSTRLTDSACCLVVPGDSVHPHLERLLRTRDQDAPVAPRILEVNADHPLVHNLQVLLAAGSHDDRVREWILTLYDQARLMEGSPLDDVGQFTRRLTELMVEATRGSCPSESPAEAAGA